MKAFVVGYEKNKVLFELKEIIDNKRGEMWLSEEEAQEQFLEYNTEFFNHPLTFEQWLKRKKINIL
jgi:hypothetical protein